MLRAYPAQGCAAAIKLGMRSAGLDWLQQAATAERDRTRIKSLQFEWPVAYALCCD